MANCRKSETINLHVKTISVLPTAESPIVTNFHLVGLDADLYGQYPARDFVVSVQQVGIFENLSTKDGPKEERQWRKDNNEVG